MIPQRPRLVSRLLVAVCAVQLVAVGLVASVLDAGAPGQGASVAEHHEGCAHFRGHDHTLCTQVGANRALEAPRPHHVPRPPTRVLPATVQGVPAAGHAPLASHPSRAPPRA